VSVAAASSPDRSVTIPLGDGWRDRVVVALAGGVVPPERIGTGAADLARALRSLSELEVEAYDTTWAARRAQRGIGDPRADPDERGDDLAGDVDEDEPVRHVAVRLHEEALATWAAFRASAPETVAWATLAALDRGASTADGRAIVTDGVRLVAVAWRPPTAQRPGEVSVRIAETGVIPGTDAERVRGLRAARGLLQSAIVSQLLHRIADRVPRTAFDLTLRSFGGGGDLLWWRDSASVPATWPRSARQQIVGGLAGGLAVAATREPIDETFGWWVLDRFGGDVDGWITGPQSPVQGSIAVGSPFSPDDVDGVLGSLPDLHRAIRWLVRAAAADGTALAELPPAACAAAGIVGELLRSVTPAGWPPAAVDGFCGG
jgi:hypothetical protein